MANKKILSISSSVFFSQTFFMASLIYFSTGGRKIFYPTKFKSLQADEATLIIIFLSLVLGCIVGVTINDFFKGKESRIAVVYSESFIISTLISFSISTPFWLTLDMITYPFYFFFFIFYASVSIFLIIFRIK